MFKWLRDWFQQNGQVYPPSFFAPPASSGLVVSQDTALTLSAVYCAVRVISEAVASLPLLLYRRLPDGGKERAEGHPLFAVLKDRPNPELTSFVFRETLQSHLLRYGNAYAEIERAGNGRPVALWILPPEHVRVLRDDSGSLLYEVSNGGDRRRLPAENVLAIPGLSHDGLQGYSPVKLARESMGLSLAADRFGSSFFGNGARPSGVLEYPGSLTDKGRENLSQSWQNLHAGTMNTGKVAILEEGMKWTSISIPNEDAQFLQTRQFQTVEIARWFNISPVFLHELGRATWGNLETLNTQFYQVTLLPWLAKWEQEIERKLLLPSEQGNYCAEFNVDGMLRADTKSRYEVYQIALTTGILTVNEVRAMENLNPIAEPLVDEGTDTIPTDDPPDPDAQPVQEDNGDTE